MELQLLRCGHIQVKGEGRCGDDGRRGLLGRGPSSTGDRFDTEMELKMSP